MLTDAALIAFVPVGDLARARQFYEDTLGLRVVEESPFAVAVDAYGTMLRLILVPDLHPQPFTVVGWRVPDIVACIDTLADRGIAFAHYDGVDQDARGIWTTPGGDQVAWFTDPDGNTLSLTAFATT